MRKIAEKVKVSNDDKTIEVLYTDGTIVFFGFNVFDKGVKE